MRPPITLLQTGSSQISCKREGSFISPPNEQGLTISPLIPCRELRFCVVLFRDSCSVVRTNARVAGSRARTREVLRPRWSSARNPTLVSRCSKREGVHISRESCCVRRGDGPSFVVRSCVQFGPSWIKRGPFEAHILRPNSFLPLSSVRCQNDIDSVLQDRPCLGAQRRQGVGRGRASSTRSS
jgi:hypothetical protein